MDIGQIITLILQGVLVVGYVVGTIIIKNHQTKKIDTLKAQIESQSKIMELMQRFMGIFDLDRVEKYVQLSEKTFQKEKEEALKKLDIEWKQRADRGASALMEELEELFILALNLTRAFAPYPVVEKSINNMKIVTVKKYMLDEFNRANLFITNVFRNSGGWVGEFLRSYDEKSKEQKSSETPKKTTPQSQP